MRLGTWVKLPTPAIIEVLADTGLDFVVIDAEHTLLNPETIGAMIALARALDLTPFVRVPGRHPRDVTALLDAGAAGLLFPHVDSAEDAREVVDACRFPPLGQRGASNTGRVGRWGDSAPAAYLATGADVTVVAQIESPRAVTAAHEIAAVEGIDALFVGPLDLSVSTGQPYAELRPEIDRLRRQLDDRSWGSVAPSGAVAAELLGDGYDFVVVSSDVGLLLSAGRAAVAGASG